MCEYSNWWMRRHRACIYIALEVTVLTLLEGAVF